jgi:hypothetical protein
MNVKTTIFLIILLGAGAGTWYWHETRRTEETLSPTETFLEKSLDPNKITRIETTRGKENRFVLQKTGTEWHLPGNWPARAQETEQWLAILTCLHSRFSPTPLPEKADLKPYGLDDAPLTVKVTAGDETHTLRFGEEPGNSNRFTRPTYVRLDEKPEVIRLGPGVLAALDRGQDYFRQRRLFPVERITKEVGKDKVEEVKAARIEVETPDAKFTIGKKAGEWILKEAFTKKDKDWKRVCSEDRLDPAKRDALLRGFPDLWADKFLDDKKKSLKECGLDEPAYVLSASSPESGKIKLLIGKVSESKMRIVKAPPNPFGPPTKPPEMINEEYRFAKLDKNDQIFELRTDKLRDIGVELDELRDAKLAHFETGDVTRLEIQHGDQTLVFIKAKEDDKDKESSRRKWRLETPTKIDVEQTAVDELIDKLAALRARDKDVLDDVDLKTVGLDKPAAQIKVTLEEADKDEKKTPEAKDDKKKTRQIVFYVGLKDKDKDKIYVRVDAWPRVNRLGDELWKLAQRSELAYRPREIWKLDHDAITKITIQADSQPYNLVRGDKAWKITGPIQAEAFGESAEKLADELTHLRCERFEASQPKDLKPFGLDNPAFKIELTTKDGKARGLEIGKAAESKEGGRFARLMGGDAVFVLSEKITAYLRASPFELLDLNLLNVNSSEIQAIRYQGADSSFTLDASKGIWQVSDSPAGSFAADDEAIKTALAPWGKLRADRYVALGDKIDWAAWGLAPAFLTVKATVKSGDKEKEKDIDKEGDKEKDTDKEAGKDKDKIGDKDKDKKPIEHVIELGKVDSTGGRFARIDKKDSVVLLDAQTTDRLVRSHLDFLDHRVLRFDGDAVTIIDRKMKDADLDLTRREDNWQITKPSIRDADNLTVFDVLKHASALRVSRVAEFPAKDLAKYGLDRPVAVVTFQLELDGAGRKHVIKVGDFVKDSAKKDTPERYALIDEKAMVVVLPAELSRHLVAPPLYFADRNLASFANVDRAELTSATRKAVFSRSARGWKMTQPIEADAEDAAIDDLIRSVQRLRADEIVADKATDLKKFGLDQPFLGWRFTLGHNEQLHLIVGAPENDQPGARRYAKLGDKNQVFLLSSKVAAKVQSECRSRAVWHPFGTDSVSKLTVSNADKTFALDRNDKKWQLAGNPKEKINEQAITNTLNILESLKAVRYVVDAKANLNPYGLENPAWKIELELAKDKRVLWLGAFEGKSKRMFATVPGTGAVFVLDEIDALILARSLSAYVKEEKKK